MIYLEGSVYMVSDKCPGVVRLPMYIKRAQGHIKCLNKGALVFVEALTEPFLKLRDVSFLIFKLVCK